MPVEEIEVIFNESPIVAGFEAITQSVEETNTAVAGTNSTIQASFDPKGIDKFADAVGDVEDEIKKTNKAASDLDKTAKKTGASINDAANSVGLLGRGFSGLRRQTQIVGRAFKALAANPVLGLFVLLVAAVTAVFKAFQSTKKGAETLAIAGAALGAIFDVLRDTILVVGSALVGVFTEPQKSLEALRQGIKDRLLTVFEGFINLIKSTGSLLKSVFTLDFDAFKQSAQEAAEAVAQFTTGTTAEERAALVESISDAGKALIEAAKAAAAAQAAIEDVVNTQRVLSVQRANLNKQLVDARAIAQDTNKTISDRLEAIEKVTKAEDAQVTAEIAAQRKLVNALKAKAALSDSGAAELDKIAQAEIKLANLQTQSKTRLLAIDRQRLTLEKQLATEQLKAANFQKQIQQQLITDSQVLAEQRLKDEKAQRDETIKGLRLSEEEKQQALLDSQKIFDSKLFELQEQARQRRQQAETQARNEELQQELVTINSKAELANIEFENKQEQERQLFAETARTAQEITDFEKQQGDERLANELRIQQERLRAIRQFSKAATDEEKARLDAQIALIETQLQGVGKVITEQQEQQKAKGLLGLLGFSENTGEQLNALKSAVGAAINVVKEGVAERIAALEQEVDFRNNNIGELQNDLDRQIELAKLGKAANIEQLQDQIEAEKKARDRAEQDKKDAAKTQFAIDTALQASNLATSISSLYASLASLPFGIGVAVATALSGVLLGSFAASKVKAAQLAGFKDGGYTGNGGISDIAGVTHGREFVLDASTTKEFGLNNMSMAQGKAHLLNNILGNQNSDIQQNISVIRSNNKTQQEALYKSAFREQIEELKAVKKAIGKKRTVIPMPNGTTVVEEEDGNGNISKRIFKS